MRHFFDMTGNGQRAKRRLRAALSEKLWDICAVHGRKIQQENKGKIRPKAQIFSFHQKLLQA